MMTRATILSLAALAVLAAPPAAWSLPQQGTGGAPSRSLAVLVKDLKKQGITAGTAAPTLGTLEPIKPGTGVAEATISVKCGNKVYEVSTGTKKGGCTTTPQGGAYCGGDGNNWAGASCAKGCEDPKGKGTCTVKSAE
jgi:hypothetical protein